jgi:hypothetical protein
MRILKKYADLDILEAARASIYWYEAVRNKQPKAIEVTREQLREIRLHPEATRDGTYLERHLVCTGQVRRRLFGIPVHLIGGRPRRQSRGMTGPLRAVRRYTKLQAGRLLPLLQWES